MDDKISYLVDFDSDLFVDRMDPMFHHPKFKDTSFSEVFLKKLGEVSEIINRKPKKGKKYRYIELGSINKNTGKIEEVDKLEEYSYENLPSRAKKVVRRGDIIVSKLVENYTVVVVGEEHDGCVATNAFMIIRPRIDISSDLLAYILKLDDIIKQFQRYGYGATAVRISNSDFKRIRIPIPTPADLKSILESRVEIFKERKESLIQRYDNRFVEIEKRFLDLLGVKLDSVDYKNNFKVKGELLREENLHPSFYKPEHLVVDQVMEDSQYQSIKLREVVEDLTIGSSLTSNAKGKLLYISSRNINRFELDLRKLNNGNLKEKEYARLSTGDILIVNAGYKLGYATVVNKEGEGLSFNNHIYRLRLKDDVIPYYIVIFLNSELAKKQFERYSGGVAHKNINLDSLLDMKILLPNQEVQQRISKEIRGVYEEIIKGYESCKDEDRKLSEMLMDCFAEDRGFLD
ncbi:type I restriction enzyme S subunit [Orenia metallireducens]|uniref:restriction endonuclease subunit S n=1 Tax=Orenia metallireducens TaxID=1413210 RepID=UPI000D06DCBB|nr:restriction endonuclease subunit S [Orenia metallireducens]PRX23251.1 type I restriction enzyme S subunit [Orenia metallireducens]